MLESEYQTLVLGRIRTLFPGCMILKNDSGYLQGIPDWIVLYENRWVMLEIKQSSKAKKQPNQDWYVTKFNSMSYAAFLYPENEEEVISGIQQAFKPKRDACVSDTELSGVA